ncbi:MAG: spermidine/putrescine ABC transporter permease [Litorilinea sp.]|nr:MAG: spermidine/putrescine ABC transporter permease [Litorilinea sp.]
MTTQMHSAEVTSKRLLFQFWRRRRPMSRLQRIEAFYGYLLISPWLLGFLFFTLGPMLASFYYSFTRYNVQTSPSFIGAENYIYAFTRDNLFWVSVQRTLTWSLLTVPLGTVGSLFAAILLNQKLKGVSVYRTFFFMPHLTPIVAAAILWMWILQPDIGVLNSLLARIGIRGPNWLQSVHWSMPALAMIALWTGIGGNKMLIFLAGLQSIPETLYEAADMDGATHWQKFINITLPMISPSMFFNLVLGIIASFQVFGMAFVTTRGGPAYATYFYALHLYQQAFVSFDMGYGSALAWIFFIAVLVLTIFQLWLQKHWVYYEGAV